MIDKGTRDAVLRLHKKGRSIHNIAQTFHVSRNSVRRIIRHRSAESSRTLRAKKARSVHSEIVNLFPIKATTIVELHREFLARGFSVPYSTFRRYCRRHGLGPASTKEHSAKAWLSQLVQGAKSSQHLAEELPTAEHLDYLVAKIKTGSLKERKKACTILARQKGISNRTIAQALHSSPRTTRSYYSVFVRHGHAHLFRSHAARNSLADEKTTRTKRVLELLHHKPQNFGINRTSWTQPSLVRVYKAQFGESISRSGVARSIRDAGFAWKKAKRVLTSPDSQYREKVEVLLSTLHSLQSHEQLFFLDELGPLAVKRRGGRGYVPRGETAHCPRRQLSKGSVTVLGALSATTNQIAWVFGKSKDTWSIIELIELLFNQYSDKSKLYITWDAVSWHNSNALIEWLDVFNTTTKTSGMGASIEVIPLPTSAQFLNVIEGVFSGVMRAVVHNSDYASEEEMKSAISKHFCERNLFFKANPRRVGKRIWEMEFFADCDNLRSGNYREW
jgi:transposase